jgi:quercetin dioxygenase-like cupin family protein
MAILAGNQETGGAFTLIDQECGVGFSTPIHVHDHEDEAFFVLEGALRVRLADQVLAVEAGGFAFLPRTIEHGFEVVGETPVRLLQITSPAGFERFASEVGDVASEPGLPPAGPVDLPALMEAAGRHGYRIVLPGDA